MNSKDYAAVLADFTKQLGAFDILHIQHELSFYKHKELRNVIGAARRLHKKVVVTVHTALEVEYIHPKLNGLSPRSVLHYARQMHGRRSFDTIHVQPLRQADLIIVHNQTTKDNLLRYGFSNDKIRVIKIPVPTLSFDTVSSEIAEHLRTGRDDIIFSTIGFVTVTKGADQAVKALNFLPSRYKLAIIGGVHPNGSNEAYLNELSDYIVHHKLQERVYITGYIKEDDRLNALIRETDICVYPFDRKYYSYVSSASLNNSFANHRPTIAYQTQPLIEVNDEYSLIKFSRSPNYYELAREIIAIDLSAQAKISEQFAKEFSYENEAQKMAALYRELFAS
jgi:glycosyltransferase involved in cell wall biosynthesis